MEITVLPIVGHIIEQIDGAEEGSEEIRFHEADGTTWIMTHYQDCCESVALNDVAGDIADLIGVPILSAEETTNSDEPRKESYDDSHTWTFYRFITEKGTVVLRWYGSSNGCYSEGVSFHVEGEERY